jgi:hypothetical protein
MILWDRCQLGFDHLADEFDERAEPSWPVTPVIRAVFGFRSIKSPFVQHQSAKAIARTRTNTGLVTWDALAEIHSESRPGHSSPLCSAVSQLNCADRSDEIIILALGICALRIIGCQRGKSLGRRAV